LSYDTWGNVEQGTPSPFGYTGREHDSESGLVFLRNRFYDPKAGRFLSEDPKRWQVSLNFYPYVDNNPATVVDPMGLQGVPAVPCPTCGAQGPNVTRGVQHFCQMAKTNKGCREALRYFGPPGGLLPCVELKCATQVPVICVPPGQDCGGCGGPCNNLSDPTKAVYVQPTGFKGICGTLEDTIAHEMSHMCGIGPDTDPNDPAHMKNKRAAQTVGALCSFP